MTETIITLLETDPNLIKVKEKFGKTHKIEAVLGTRPLLKLLQANQSVCWGDGKKGECIELMVYQ